MLNSLLRILILFSSSASSFATVRFEIHHSDSGFWQVKAVGSTAVYWPELNILDKEGRWLRLSPSVAVTALEPGRTAAWEMRSGSSAKGLHHSQSLRVRFQDQSGWKFTQFVTLHPWPGGAASSIELTGGQLLTLSRPLAKEVAATWVLGTQESAGRVPTRMQTTAAEQLEEPEPRIEWSSVPGKSVTIPVLSSQGPWLLLHEATDATQQLFDTQLVQVSDGTPQLQPGWTRWEDEWAIIGLLSLAWAGARALIQRGRQDAPAET